MSTSSASRPATRPWPQPAAGEPDYIIRTPAHIANLMRRMLEGPLPLEAAAEIEDHCIACEVMLDMREVWRCFGATAAREA